VSAGSHLENCVGIAIMLPSHFRNTAAYGVDYRMCDCAKRRFDWNSRTLQKFAWQIEATQTRVFVEIPKNVGELQGASKMMRERETGLLLHTEYLDGKPANGTRHAVAIQVKRLEIGRDHGAARIHLHAVDNGEKVCLA